LAVKESKVKMTVSEEIACLPACQLVQGYYLKKMLKKNK
jgi:hypothetical protein